MHMADALVTPVVGGGMWAASAGILWYCSEKLKKEFENIDNQKISLMGVIGAFVFAAQMINFTIPATGSSGHLGGGMLLSILLGPYAAFVTMSSVLIIQALFFADGGLLSLGCNMFNLGFFPCFIAYPLIFKSIAGNHPTRSRIIAGTIISAIIGLQLGSLGVVCQTWLSGVSELPFSVFILAMQPIHLAIGIVEGLATVVVVMFIWESRPEIITSVSAAAKEKKPLKAIIFSFLAATILLGGIFSWFASENPDGLEWAISKTSGKEHIHTPDTPVYNYLSEVQDSTSILPDYGFNEESSGDNSSEGASGAVADSGTTIAGLVGSAMVLLMVLAMRFLFRLRPSKS